MTTSSNGQISTASTYEIYDKDTPIWVSDVEVGWKAATVTGKKIQGKEFIVEYFDEDGQSGQSKALEGQDTLPPLRNPPALDGIDDLTNLSYLNEPGVLHNIYTRYCLHNIYTYSGIVLIAVNPFERVNLYSQDLIQAYYGKLKGELEPHLFAIAEDAYRCMIKDMENQTVIVSGESGAGKTVSAKYIMRYFASVNNLGKGGDFNIELSKTEEQILATNPILESFGNAKTTRNDNSSRFGKYIEIQFDPLINIVGARIRTYLLERSRLIFQPLTERNYHIFYQLCVGAPAAKKQELLLMHYNDYFYLNQGGMGEIKGVDDAKEFEDTCKALSLIGINDETQWQIFQLLSGILYLGNIKVGGNDKSGASIPDTDEALVNACKLLGLKVADFRKWMMKKQIVTRTDKIISNLNPSAATVVKDSSAKFLYSNLFDWLIVQVNSKLSNEDVDHPVASFIGVLDIYGFEHFEKNSFEQFCINYANEKLQQQFNQHVFKLEQEEYSREEINWTYIEFSDNQPCIDLIEGKIGVLSLLDEQSRLPSGSDEGLIGKLYDTLGTSENEQYFSKPRFSTSAFTISHYAHHVSYEIEGFLEKNRDTVPDEILQVFQSSEMEFLRSILPVPQIQVQDKTASIGRGSAGGGSNKKQTLGSVFKGSLQNLMETISVTNVHYIRCIKPNEAKEAWKFENQMVLSQLRACGVLETIKISCSGYPSRKTLEEFASRYYIILPPSQWIEDVRGVCQSVCDFGLGDPNKFQIGKTKIFFRAGQLAYIEKLRNQKINKCAVFIQKNVRRMLCRKKYLRMRWIKTTQTLIGYGKASKKFQEILYQTRAAKSIQAKVRGYLARKKYLSRLHAVINVQTHAKGLLARRRFKSIREERAAIKIQTKFRAWSARKSYLQTIHNIILIQCLWRKRAAKKQYRKLKAEAGSVIKLKETTYQLENKIVSMSQQLMGKNNEVKVLVEQVQELEGTVLDWKSKHTKIQASLQQLRESNDKLKESQKILEKVEVEKVELDKRCSEYFETMKAQEEEITTLRTNLQDVTTDKQKLESTFEEKEQTFKAEIEKLKLAAQKASIQASSMSNLSSTRAPPPAQLDVNASFNGFATISSSQSTLLPDTPTSPSARSLKRSSMLSLDHRHSRSASSWNPLSFFQPASEDLPDLMTSDNDNIASVLQNESLLDEIVEGLIVKLNIPLPNFQHERKHEDLFFPAHLIGNTIILMHQYELGQRIEDLIEDIVGAVRKVIEKADGDFLYAFWFSNISELLGILLTANNDIDYQPSIYSNQGAEGSLDPQQAAFEAVKTLNTLLVEIMTLWLKDLQKRLGKMVVSGIIENQSLPGFFSKDAGFFNKIINQTQKSIDIDTVLNFFTLLYNTMKYYHIDTDIIDQVVEFLLNTIGVAAFNHIIMRKNFCSWKRGMQIQYNITRLEEWCRGKSIEQEAINLEQFMQAAKLLQVQKTSLHDIEVMYDVCHLLNKAQVKKLISVYYLSDYENPIGPEILKEVARRAALSEKTDHLFLEAKPPRLPLDFREHFSGKYTEVDKYYPNHLNLPRLKYLVNAAAS